MSTPPQLVLVGHCGPDVFLMKSALGRAVPDVVIEAINDEDHLESHLHPSALLLVNRVLDGRFVTDRGIDLIRRVLAVAAPPVAMLVSDLSDAQAEAIAVGARLGFGKSELYDDDTIDRVRSAVA